MRTLLFAVAMSMTALSGCAKSGDASGAAVDTNIPIITVDELAKDLEAKAATPVDCNGDNTRKRQGTIPGAVLVSDEEKFAASELPADKATKLVFYCGGPG